MNNKKVQIVAEIDTSKIILELHNKALSQIKDNDYIVINSAIDGNGSNAKFYGSGDHMIIATSKNNNDDNKKIPKDKALELIKTYVQWYSGVDLIQDINLDSLNILDVEQNESQKNSIRKRLIENNLYSFEKYLLEDAETTDNDVNSQKKSDTESDDKKSSDEQNDEKSDDEQNDNIEEANGYYIVYKVELPGQKAKPLSAVLKKIQ